MRAGGCGQHKQGVRTPGKDAAGALGSPPAPQGAWPPGLAKCLESGGTKLGR